MMACGILDMRTAECAVYLSSARDTCRRIYVKLLTDCDDDDDDDAARWSPDRKWKTVSVDPSGTVATKTGTNTFGYIQTTEAVSKGVHTW